MSKSEHFQQKHQEILQVKRWEPKETKRSKTKPLDKEFTFGTFLIPTNDIIDANEFTRHPLLVKLLKDSLLVVGLQTIEFGLWTRLCIHHQIMRLPQASWWILLHYVQTKTTKEQFLKGMTKNVKKVCICKTKACQKCTSAGCNVDAS